MTDTAITEHDRRRSELLADVCLVACAAGKRPSSMPAESLYDSVLFNKAKAFAENYCKAWFILSAKHGLLRPSKVIAPYDETLGTMSPAGRKAWSERVFASVSSSIDRQASVIMLAGENYKRDLLPLLHIRGHTVSEPLTGLSIGRQIQWLGWANENPARIGLQNEAYKILQHLRDSGQFLPFRDTRIPKNFPKRGVYFFADDSEPSVVAPTFPRLVRVGTHAVSAGSESTLWQRLRTHRGASDFRGNHRSSIFRLHVGAALIARDSLLERYQKWGVGRTATIDIRVAESNHERTVSEYLGRLLVGWVGVGDPAGPSSDRAYIERNLIALLSNQLKPFDLPSRQWLGKFSPVGVIRSSGLWNINHVDEEFDSNVLDVLRAYAEGTIRNAELSEGSLAPKDWLLRTRDRSRNDHTQFSLI